MLVYHWMPSATIMDFSSSRGVFCPDCGNNFLNEKIFLKHQKQYHLEAPGGSKCETCGKEFNTDLIKRTMLKNQG